MKGRLFLSSQIHFVAESIGLKLGSDISQPAVFIDTPIRDKQHSNLGWHEANKNALSTIGLNFDNYDIAGKTNGQIKRDLDKYGIIYIEGGNSYYLLQESQKNGFGAYLKARIDSGLIYLSTSAGSVIVGPDIEPVRREETTALAPSLKGTKGFGIVNFVIMPHWGDEKRRDLYNNYRLEHIYQEDYPYILISNNQYVEVKNDWINIVDVSKEPNEK